MAVLALPPLLFNVSGSRISAEDRDPLALSLTTAGNLGSEASDQTFLNATASDLAQCSALRCASALLPPAERRPAA